MSSAAARSTIPSQHGVKPIEFRYPRLREVPDEPVLALDAVAAGQAQEALTYGWDTAFAIRVPDANSAIVKAKTSPSSFSQEAPDKSCSASGTFGAWQISGGDGVDVHFDVPIEKGSLLYKGKNYPMDGATVTIEVQLQYIPPQPKPPPSGGKLAATVHKLVTKNTAAANNNVVSVVGFSLDPAPPFVQKALMMGVLQYWFNENLDSFSQTFSAVTLNRKVDKKQFEWLAPTHTGYAVAKGATLNDSVLGVLCMTQGRSAKGLAAQISPNAIPVGGRSGFLIARERFLEEMVLPSLPKAFPGSTHADFAMSSDKTKVVNTNPVKTKTVEHMGTTYHPVVHTLEIYVQGEEIVVHTITRTDIALGSYSETTVTTFQKLKVANKPDGTQTLVYETSSKPIKDHTVKTTASGKTLKIILEIAAAIVTIVLTIATDGAFLVIALIISSLLVGLLEAIPKLIANVVGNKVSNDSPSLALLVLNSTAPITWPDGGDYELTAAGLNDSLQLAGNPGFV